MVTSTYCTLYKARDKSSCEADCVDGCLMDQPKSVAGHNLGFRKKTAQKGREDQSKDTQEAGSQKVTVPPESVRARRTRLEGSAISL